MTVIRPNSVAGINSITVASGSALAVHKADGTLIQTIAGTSGVSTFSSVSVGSATTTNDAAKSINIGLGASISQHSNNTLTFGTNGDPRITIDASGDFNVGSAATIKAGGNATFSGIVTAASFIGDGSGLTGAGPTLTGSTNNTIVTVTGANAIQGESTLTFDGSTLVVTPTSSDARVTILGSEGNDARLSLISDDGDDHIDQYNLRVAASDNRFYIDQFESGAFQERLTIANGGNTGIGTNAPDSLLHVFAPSVGYAKIETRDGGTNPIIMHENPDRIWHAGLRGDSSDGYVIRDATAASNRLTIDTSGNITVNNGNLVIGTSGKGIDFSANSQASGMTSELLDHYEEGTFSLTVNSGGFSSVTGTGTYTRSGRTVIFQGDFSLVGTGDGTILKLDGLPYAANSWCSCSGYAQYYNNEGSQQASWAVRGNTNDISVVEYGNEATGNAFSAGYMNIAGCYQV